MKKVFILFVIAIFLSGCTNTTEDINIDLVRTSCLNGVTYYHYAENKGSGYKGYGYLAPAYKTDGSLILCEETKGYKLSK